MEHHEPESDAARAERQREHEREIDKAETPRARLFEPMTALCPYGAASISLLLHLLIDRTTAQAWSEQRQRVHARALLELACDHYFSDEELHMLCAFVR